MSLETRDAEVWRGRGRVVGPLSLQVHPGELLAVVGPNGAGKSSLVAALSGELTCRAGDVLLEGRPLRQWPLVERAQRLGVLPQESTLGFGFTALEVAALGRSPHARRGGAASDVEVARAALDATDTQHLASRSYLTLSGGERQRVQLARVLAQLWAPVAHGHRYLLLDEPTASLDLAHQHLVLERARAFAREGGGVLAVLHDLNLAARYADRLAVLERGRCVDDGSPARVLTPERVASTFGLRAEVVTRPDLPGPLVVPLGRAAASLDR